MGGLAFAVAKTETMDSQMTNAESNLTSKLADWLDSQGYPLEMRVARTFAQAGFAVTQSDFYSDPETGDFREIDVVAYKDEILGEAHLQITVCVECKAAKEKPWIVFTDDKPKHEWTPLSMTRLGFKFLQLVRKDQSYKRVRLFRSPSSVGYGLTQAFTSGKDIPYAAAISVSKCAIAKEIVAEKYAQVFACHIILPMVVLDGRLFECHLDETSRPKLSEVESAVITWRNPPLPKGYGLRQLGYEGHSRRIHVIKITQLPVLAKQISEAAEFLFQHGKELDEATEWLKNEFESQEDKRRA